MARAEIGEVVLNTSGEPVAGASVQVNIRDAAAATVYQAETGGSTHSNPLTTDAAGRIEGWLDEGSYDLEVSGAGIDSYTYRLEAVSGGNLPGKLLTAQGDLVYASAANTLGRLAAGGTGSLLRVTGGLPGWLPVGPAGALLYVSSSNPAWLTAGSEGDVLTMTSGVPAWASASSGAIIYRKTATKDVANTVAETDLLNGEVTVAAGVLGTNKTLRATLDGDMLQNAAGDFDFNVKLDGTTLLSVAAANVTQTANRRPWKMVVQITNRGAANVQHVSWWGQIGPAGGSSAAGLGGWEGLGATAAGLVVGETDEAVDTSASALLEVTAHWSAASASLSWRLHNAVVELI